MSELLGATEVVTDEQGDMCQSRAEQGKPDRKQNPLQGNTDEDIAKDTNGYAHVAAIERDHLSSRCRLPRDRLIVGIAHSHMQKCKRRSSSHGVVSSLQDVDVQLAILEITGSRASVETKQSATLRRAFEALLALLPSNNLRRVHSIFNMAEQSFRDQLQG